MTGWAMLGLEAAGRNPLDVGRAGRTPVAYLEDNVGAINSPNELELAILALEAAGLDSTPFAGREPRRRPARASNPATARGRGR